MILFSSDWSRFPNAIPDYATKNTSFVYMAKVLHKMGVKNCLFHLSLLNPELQGVDPFDEENLTDDQKQAILLECTYNPWYVFREIIRIPPKAGTKDIPFKINRANLALYWLFFNHIEVFLIMARQQGKALPLDTLIRIPDGWKRNGDIKVGDFVIAVDGTVTKVTETFQLGKLKTHTFTFEDGRTISAGTEHLWRVYDPVSDIWKVIDTGEVIELHALVEEQGKSLVIPLPCPEQKDDVVFETPLNEIAVKVLLGELSSLPPAYREGSHYQRDKLLRLLLADDVDYRTMNKALADDIVYLARSVGGMARIESAGDDWVVSVVYPEYTNGTLAISTIEYKGEEESLCFAVEHPDHMYVAENFIVTHNTVAMSALVQGCLRFWMNNSLCTQVTKDTKLKLETIDTIKEIGNRIPSYLVDVNVTIDNPENKTEIYYGAKNNRFKSAVGRNDKKAANGVGRGSTSPFMWFDEPPFTPFIEITVSAAIGGMSAVVDEAKESKQPYGVVFTTTPGKVDDRDGRPIYEMVQQACPFNEGMYDSENIEALEEHIKTNSIGDGISVNCTFTPNQLGYSDDWVRERIAKSHSNKEQADMDYRVLWSTGSAENPLTVEQLEAISASEKEPLWQEQSKDGYIIRWYTNPITHKEVMATGSFVLGMDSSEMVNKDATAVVITSVRDFSVVGVATVKKSNTTRFTNWIADVLTTYPKITGIIERKSTGTGILDQLLYVLPGRGIDPFKRLYNKVMDEQHTKSTAYKEVKSTALARRTTYFTDPYRQDFGLATDKRARQVIYGEVLMEAAKRGASKIHDRVLINELKSLITKNNRIDHPPGGHDDHVIAWLMTAWFLLVSKHHIEYGIEKNTVFSDITDTGESVSEEDRERGEFLKQLKERLEEITDELSLEDNPYAVVKLEQMLRVLNQQISTYGGEAVNIDGLIDEAKNNREQIRYNRSRNQSRWDMNDAWY